ncbi:MAG: amidohydrolase family protein [Vicinamibacteria bacterium]
MNSICRSLALLTISTTSLLAQELQDGPYSRLVIRGAMVIPGHGGPAYGPADVVIENDTITHIVAVPHGGSSPQQNGDRVIDAEGLWLMPGLIDLHTHIREEPLPLEYVYFMKLAHGVTTMVHGSERGFERALEQAKLSKANRIAAPRLYPIRDWGPARSRDPGHAPPLEDIAPWHDPSKAPELAPGLIAEGAHVIRIGSLAWNRELFGAVATAVDEAGGITTVHLPPSDIAVVNALNAAELGVTMIEHHYGYAEAALEGTLQRFPFDYNYADEADRFRHAARVWREASPEKLLGEVVDRLVASGVSMIPTLSAYEANRDINRAMGLPWHDLYTHRLLIEWFWPNPASHAAQHWDWTSGDEVAWSDAYRLWQKLIKTFNDRGGLLAYAADDPYFWNTSGIANVRELQLMEETGIHPLEVIRSATRNAALTLKRPDLGLVQTGYKADLILVEGNPLKSFRYLYSFGALTMEGENMVRRGGIRWTIRNGVVFDDRALMAEVLKMVAESKKGWTDPRKDLFGPLSPTWE